MEKEKIIQFKLIYAKENAKIGDIELMNLELLLANKHAIDLGINISEEIETIKKEGYENAINYSLSKAKKYAINSREYEMEEEISYALKLSDTINKNIMDDINHITNLALESNINFMKKCARKGNIDSLLVFSECVRYVSAISGSNREQKINEIEREAYMNKIIKLGYRNCEKEDILNYYLEQIVKRINFN